MMITDHRDDRRAARARLAGPGRADGPGGLEAQDSESSSEQLGDSESARDSDCGDSEVSRNWNVILHPDPVPGGRPELVRTRHQARSLVLAKMRWLEPARQCQ